MAPRQLFGQMMRQFGVGMDDELNAEMTEIMDKLPSSELPERLNAEDQSIFSVGYAHEQSYLKHK